MWSLQQKTSIRFSIQVFFFISIFFDHYFILLDLIFLDLKKGFKKLYLIDLWSSSKILHDMLFAIGSFYFK